MLARKPIVYQTREEYVASQLRRLIVQGEIEPGAEIDQSSLAKQLGVSRSPVRDAVRRLAAEGLLCITPHKQAVVPHLTTEDLAEIYRILACLEGLAASMAVEHMRAADLEALRSILEAMAGDVTPAEWVRMHGRFHSTICELAKSPRLADIIDNLRTLRHLASPYVRDYVTNPKNKEESLVRHGRILAACEARDGTLAGRESERHIHQTWEDVKAMLAGESQ